MAILLATLDSHGVLKAALEPRQALKESSLEALEARELQMRWLLQACPPEAVDKALAELKDLDSIE